MARVALSSVAYVDTEAILRDLAAKAGVFVAARYDADFKALYRRLAQFPGSGAPRPALGQHIRIGVVPPYVVIYRHLPGSDVVGIVRLLHGSRRIARKLLRGAL